MCDQSWLARGSVRMEPSGLKSSPVYSYSRKALLEIKSKMTREMTTSYLKKLEESTITPQEVVKLKHKKRGKRGDIRTRLHQRFSRPPLPSIIFSNLHSLNNKVDTIRSNTRYCNEFREASLLCFTKSWLQPSMPDSLFELPGFTLIRADRGKDSGRREEVGRSQTEP